MPLIDITCKPKSYPPATSDGTKAQQFTEQFGLSLPALFVNHCELLGLNEGTPEAAVQVDYHRFHAKAVNAPDMWVLVRFSEPYPGNKKARRVRNRLDDLIRDWYDHNSQPLPDIAVDLMWGPTHGFLEFGNTSERW